MKSTRFVLLVTSVVVTCVLSFGFFSWANVYTRGRHSCEDFAEAKQLYNSKPQNISYEIYYSICLSLNGNHGEGLNRLRRIAKQNNHVFAALFVTEYVETGGRFEFPLDYSQINEAINGYRQVLTYIDHEGSSYPQSEPIDYTIYERSEQMELRAYYHIPYLYMNKFSYGFHGLYRKNLLTSLSYNGDRNLRTYPNYSPHTLDSLDEVIRSANRCLSLPPKRHFKPNRYEYYQKQCRLLKEAALALQPREKERLVLLNTEPCKRDLPNCGEYNEIHQKIKDIIKKLSSEMKIVSNQYNIGLL